MDILFGVVAGFCLGMIISYVSWRIGAEDGYRAGAEVGYDEGFTDGENSKTTSMPTTTGGFLSAKEAIRSMSKPRGDE